MYKVITLTSSDDQKITIDQKSAERSGLLKGLDYEEEKSEIPLLDFRGDVVKKVVEYLIHYQSTEPRELPKPLPSANLLDVTDVWDVSFLESVDLVLPLI